MPVVTEADILASYTGDPRFLDEKKSVWIAYDKQLRYGHGVLGAHRRYLGYTRSARIQMAFGILALATPLLLQTNAYGLYLLPLPVAWQLIDLCLMPSLTRKANDRLLRALAEADGALPLEGASRTAAPGAARPPPPASAP